MGNFIGSTLNWKPILSHISTSKIEILPESNQNLIILNWIIQQWLNFHEKEILPEIRKAIGWSGELDVSEYEDFLHIPLFNNESNFEKSHGFVSRLQIQEITSFLQQDTIFEKRFRNIEQRYKQIDLPTKEDEGKKISFQFYQKAHIVFSEGILYEINQQEAPERNIPGYLVKSHCKILNLNYAWMHFYILKNSKDMRRSAIDLLNLIQEYRPFINEWCGIGINMFSNDFWGAISSAKQWEETSIGDRRLTTARMRSILYIQNLDAYLCKQWINTKLLRNYAKKIFVEVQKTHVHRDVYDSNENRNPIGTIQLHDENQISKKRKLIQNSNQNKEKTNSLSNNKNQTTKTKSEVIYNEKISRGRRESQSVPPEAFRRHRAYPQPIITSIPDISNKAQELDELSDGDEEELPLSPRKKDFRLIAEIDQKFSNVVRQLKTKQGKSMETSVLIAVQYIQNLPLSEKNYQFALSDSNAIVSLLNLLTYEDMRVRFAAADILSQVSENPHLQLEICDMEGLQIILSIIQTSNHVGFSASIANILNKCTKRSVVRERLLNSRNSLGILFTKIEVCLNKENSSQRNILRQLLNIIYQISLVPSSHLRIHEYNPIRTYGMLLDNFYQFTDELTTEDESSSLLIPIFGFISNICKEARNVKLVNQLKLNSKIYRTILIHQDTEDKVLRRSMSVLIGRISSKSNISIMIHTQILDILNRWLLKILSIEPVSIDDASAILYALSKCTQWDSLLELFITEIALKDSNVFSRILSLVSLRQDLKTFRSSMHALALISNLSRHPSIANQMVEKGVIGMVCSSLLTSSIPNFVVQSLEILMHICENKVTEEILKEMSAYGTFTLLPKLMENKHISIQIGAMQTLCAMITDENHADSVVKFGPSEYGLPPIIIKILEGLSTSFNSSLESRALELDLGKLFDGVMQLIKKLLLSESNLKFFSDSIVIHLILNCMSAERQEVQPSNFAFSSAVLSFICKEVPETVDIIYNSPVVRTLIRFLKKISNQPFKNDAKETEENEFSTIGILNLLTVLCKYDKCVDQICYQNPIEMFLSFLDYKNEIIQELTSEVLFLMRNSLTAQLALVAT